MRTLPDTSAIQTASSNTAAAGVDCVITVNAVSDEYHVIDFVAWSYGAAPTSGSLTIVDTTNNTTHLTIEITAAGPGMLSFGERGLRLAKNATLTVTLGGTNAAKRLSIQRR